MQEAPFKCTYCGQPSWIDPSDQSPPTDYCHGIDHGTAEAGKVERQCEKIRAALAMGPTPGPWDVSYVEGSAIDVITQTGKTVCMMRGIAYFGKGQYLANGCFIAACDPDTIRALLDERDGLAAENEMLRAALQAIVNEVSAGLVPYSSDSYLPVHLVEQARAALGM